MAQVTEANVIYDTGEPYAVKVARTVRRGVVEKGLAHDTTCDEDLAGRSETRNSTSSATYPTSASACSQIDVWVSFYLLVLQNMQDFASLFLLQNYASHLLFKNSVLFMRSPKSLKHVITTIDIQFY
jgi:hypothetical protein